MANTNSINFCEMLIALLLALDLSNLFPTVLLEMMKDQDLTLGLLFKLKKQRNSNKTLATL